MSDIIDRINEYLDEGLVSTMTSMANKAQKAATKIGKKVADSELAQRAVSTVKRAADSEVAQKAVSTAKDVAKDVGTVASDAATKAKERLASKANAIRKAKEAASKATT